MAFRLGNRSARTSVGLDLDGSYVAAVAMSAGVIEHAASVEMPSGLVRDGEVEDVQAVSHLLRDFMKEHGFGRNVWLGVANQQIAVRSLDIPPIDDDNERAAAVRFQASEAVAMPLDEAILDYQVISQSTAAAGPESRRVIVVAAREPMIMRLVDAIRAAGL